MALTGGPAILARLRAKRAAVGGSSTTNAATPDVLVLYASQTGTGQEIAKSIHADAAKQGITNAKVMSFNECGIEALSATPRPIVIVVASSTGDGDPPDNAAKAFVQLRRKSNPPDMLTGLRYTVLGLGDSNYTRFMYVPRCFKTRLAELGGTPFYEPAEADEVEGLEEVVDVWVEGLWEALKAVLKETTGEQKSAAGGADASNGATAHASHGAAGGAGGVAAVPPPRVRLVFSEEQQGPLAHEQGPTAEALAYRDATGQYSTEQPFWAPVVDARYLTTPSSTKRVVHLALNLKDSGMQYKPGDSIGIAVHNDAALVEGLLKRLGVEGDRVFSVVPAEQQGGGGGAGGGKLLPHLQWPCTLKHALTVGVDLTSPPRKSLLHLLAAHCSDPTEASTLNHLASREGREAYSEQITNTRPSLLTLLQRFASCAPPLDALLDALPALAPRMYSIACAPVGDTVEQAHVAFSVVEFTTPPAPTRGVATGYLEDTCAPWLRPTPTPQPTPTPLVRLPVHHRSGGAFTTPTTLSVPWIMIGPGTGVAPFCGFLQARRAAMQNTPENGTSIAPAWLFFGCRRAEEDYLYREELEKHVAEGTLTQLHVAFSRDPANPGGRKVYVQHLRKKHAAALFGMLEEEAYVFVCGDGAGMAKDVHACLLEILQAEGGLEKKEAEEQLATMAKAGRYVRDIWS